MSRLHRLLCSGAAIASLLAADPALANFAISPQGASTLFAVDSSNTSATGTGGCASVECAANVPIDKSGAPFGVSGNPFYVTPQGGSIAVTGTFWQTTQPVSGTVTSNQGGSNWTQNVTQFGGTNVSTGTGTGGAGIPRVTVSSDSSMTVNPTTAANWGIGTIGGTVPGNGVLGMMTNGSANVALQGDATNGLWVNIKSGAGSGGTAIQDNATFTQSTTNETPIGCLANSGTQTSATAGHSTVVACTLAGSIHTTVDNTNGNITPADGISTTTYGAASPVIGSSLLWNGTTYDRAKEGVTTGSTLVVTQPLTTIEKAGVTNTAVQVKASAGYPEAVNCDNANTGSVILEIFNTSTVTLGTTAPSWHVAIPAGGGGSNIPASLNIGGSAIYIAAVTAYNGSTAPSTTLNCAVGYL